MMKLGKISMTLVCSLIMLGANAQDVFDFNTGVGGTPSSPTPIALGGNDDTWSVEIPGFTVVTPKVCTPHPNWAANTSCTSQWLTSSVDSTGYPNLVAAGDYRYFTSFNITKCPQSAVLNISKIGGDNEIIGLRVNSNVYTFNPLQTNDFSPLVGPTPIVINPAHLITGTNTISFTVRNHAATFSPTTIAGFYFCGNLTVNNWPDPVPAISGSTVFCQNDAPEFTFTGSVGAGSPSITQYQWQLLGAGTTVIYSSAITNGTPGSFTFPSSLFLCDRSYRVRLRVKNCNTWYQVDKIVQYLCPVANAGPDKNVCEDVCVTIGNNANTGAIYTWTRLGSPTVIGTGPQITVCPTATTTYVVTANHNGCTDVDEVKLTYYPNNPDFTINFIPGTFPYYGVSAPAVDVNGFSLPGFLWHWEIQELNPVTNAPYYTNVGSNCWWTYPGQTFQGFTAYPTSFTQNQCSTLTNPPGKFLYNRKYRITRATKNDYCDWNQTSQIIMLSPRPEGGAPVVTMYKDLDAPSIIDRLVENGNANMGLANNNTADALNVFPNPSTGVFTVSLSNATDGTVDVLDLMGKKIQSLQMNANTNVYQIDLTDYAKGVYIINITRGGIKQSKKIILQ